MLSAFGRALSRGAALLAVAVLLTACGTGISLDPISLDRPEAGDPGGDGSLAEAGDALPFDDAAGQEADASFGEDGARSDSGSDASELLDRTGENGVTDSDVARDDADDVSIDVSTDVSMDRAADAEIDRDASIDAGIDPSTDAGVDRDGKVADSDTRDVSSDSSDARDAPKDTEREVVSADTTDGCTVGCGQSEFDYYVDANAPPDGDGSQGAPFRTISAAVGAHVQAANQARKAYVAAGTYDEAHGEIFPLMLRGLSLQGAGSDKTFIVGSGMFDHAGQGGPKNEQYMVTIVAGDRALPTKVSRLSLRPVAPVPAQGYHGLFCDRGNATGEVASPAGQTHLDEIRVGPGYDTGVLAVTSTIPVVTGCNLLMTRSEVTGGFFGVEGLGCRNNSAGPVMLQMGTDDPASGNTVTWMQSTAMGLGVSARDCVVRASFQYNTISDCNIGLIVEGYTDGPIPGSVHPFSIKHNTFARMSHQGLIASGIAVFIDEVSDNRFFGTTRVPTSNERGAAMRIWSPIVGKVRRNVFAGNDIGLVLNQGAEQTDLGRPGDPGGNVFSCNSGIDGWLGADVVVLYPMMSPLHGGAQNLRRSRFVRDDDGGLDAGDADTPTLLPFAGNSWDHVPPRVVSDIAENGVEISLEWAPPLVFDLSGSSLVTSPCPAGRIP